MKKIRPYAKAVVAGLATGIAAAVPLADHGFSLKELLVIAGAVLAGAFPTWAVPNRASDPQD